MDFSLSARRTLGITLVLSGALAIAGVAVRREMSGLGLSAELEQGLAQLLFVAAFALPSLAGRAFRSSASQTTLRARNLIYAFAGAYLAFLLTVALQGAVRPEPPPLSMLIYLSTNALVLGVVIATRKPQQDRQAGSRIGQVLHMLALAFFWTIFALLDYARIGRSRLSDPYFTIAFALLVAALVLRLADLWLLRRRLAEKVG